jgi:hypothetical protein
MARGIYVCFISLLLLSGVKSMAQDTVMVPLHIRAGFDVAGPIGTIINKNMVSISAMGAVDIDEYFSLMAGARYTGFSANEFTYDYKSKGLSFVLGSDVNLLKPKLAEGKHYIGVGLHYGLSFYNQEAPRIEYSNPWGTAATSLPRSNHIGHFLEFTPGVRTELFPGVTIGWSLSLRLLLSDGANDNLKPVYMPGYGDASSKTSLGASYFISISIPYRTKRVIIKPKVETETDEESDESDSETNTETNSGTNSTSAKSLRNMVD